MTKRFLVTGGAGFIGSAVVRQLIASGHERVVIYDNLTYAGREENLVSINESPAYRFVKGDICNQDAFSQILNEEAITNVLHLAAESHVDRSIDGPADFIDTNILGTFCILSASLKYWRELEAPKASQFRFQHISTDEVFGDLPFDESLFTETTPYAPSSPYSASKAASDHLVRAWGHTYKLPVVLSNCSNNYGPFHFPEKLIPLVILNALDGKPLPIYGKGENVRDWLHVEDHAKALELIALKGRPGESYNVGGKAERTNLEVVRTICDILDTLRPKVSSSYHDQISFVSDRPGHDRRYAIDISKIERELDWHPSNTFEVGLRATVQWYLDNDWWWKPIREASYSGQRLGQSVKV